VDLFTGLDLTSKQPTEIADRLENKKSAIGVRGSKKTSWRLPPAVYFNDNFSITAWIRVHSCHEWSPFLFCRSSSHHRQNASGNQIEVYLSYNTSCRPFMNVGSGNEEESDNDGNMQTVLANQAMPANGSWTHFAVSVTGELAQVYMNGWRVVKDDEVEVARAVVRDECFLGLDSHWFDADADFDEIKIFNRGLSHAEIMHDYRRIESFVRRVV
jgi:hypothetical protein